MMQLRTPQVSTETKPARIEGVAVGAEVEAEARDEEDEVVIKATTKVNGNGIGKMAPP